MSASKGAPGEEIPVQFNPTSLRVSTTNQTESGQALGVRKRQYLASGAAKLTMQLVFDTADEGTTERPPPDATRNRTHSLRNRSQLAQARPRETLQGRVHPAMVISATVGR